MGTVPVKFAAAEISALESPALGSTGPLSVEAVRIAAWSGPRNLSTAMMRSWESRSDCEVMDEPLYGVWLAASGADHPLRKETLAAWPIDPETAVAACLAPLPDGVTVSYQKHMAHHLLADTDRSWLDDLHNILLIRDPRRVLLSYTKVWDEVSLESIGLPQQLELMDRAALIIDSDDFLATPAGYLDAICSSAGVPFDEQMLSWPPGPRSSDGPWGPAWYSAVERSTGFGPAPSEPPAPLSGELGVLADQAYEIYQELHGRRLILSP